MHSNNLLLKPLHKSKIIGLTGVARVGKDSFFNAFKELYPHKTITKISIGDIIRDELDEFISTKANINVWNCTNEEKEKIRPLLAWYGDFKRKQTDGRYFLNKLASKIYDWKADVCVITDIRFKEFEFDEPDYIQYLDGLLIHIQRTLPDGSVVLPINELEKKNDPILYNLADHKIIWKTYGDSTKLNQYLQEYIKTLELL